MPKSSLVIFPKPLSTLYQHELLQLNYDELLTRCELVLVDITQEMADAVELKVSLNFGLSKELVE